MIGLSGDRTTGLSGDFRTTNGGCRFLFNKRRLGKRQRSIFQISRCRWLGRDAGETFRWVWLIRKTKIRFRD